MRSQGCLALWLAAAACLSQAARGPAQVTARAGNEEPLPRCAEGDDLRCGDPIPLAEYAQQLERGEPVLIECWGSSTYYGLDPGNGGLPAPANPPAMLEYALRTYYRNSAATVVNRGVSGAATYTVIRNWDAAMRASPAQVVYINYATNDALSPRMTPGKYRQNLFSMVLSARSAGKSVLLDTPHAVLQGLGGMKPEDSEAVKQFASVMRGVARALNVALVDSFQWSEEYYRTGCDLASALPDGLHLSRELMKAKGFLMAAPLILPGHSAVTGPSFVPFGSSVTHSSSAGKWNGTSRRAASRTGLTRCAETHTLPLFVGAPGLDLYVAVSTWSDGPPSVDLLYDGEVVANVNLRDPQQTVMAVDQEVMVAEDVAPGLHIVELTSPPAGGCISASYARLHPSRRPLGASKASSEPAVQEMRQRAPAVSAFEFTSAESDAHVLTDVPVSRSIRAVEVELDAAFGPEEGMVLFGHRMSQGAAVYPPHGGLYVYLNAGGQIAVREGVNTGYGPEAVLGGGDRRGQKCRYRVSVTTGGLVEIGADGTKIGEYVLTRPLFGGFLGFYRKNPGSTRIDLATVY